MDEAFEDEDADEGWLAELPAGEVASIGQDWDVVTAMLPAQWQAKAVELGAMRRLRGFDSVEALLRVLLIHLADGCSLRETVVRARAGDLADVSDVALLKRLRGCGPWFQWMAQELAASMSLPVAPDKLLAGRRVRLVDGSSVCEPGATGSTWRLHYVLNLHTLSCEEVHVTEATKKRREVRPETLEAAGYVIVLTTLMEPSAQAIMEFYRRRWQIELAFKRLKSLLQLGHLKKFDPDGAKAWLQGKILVACLIETLILTAERFSPWGYPKGELGIPASALALA